MVFGNRGCRVLRAKEEEERSDSYENRHPALLRHWSCQFDLMPSLWRCFSFIDNHVLQTLEFGIITQIWWGCKEFLNVTTHCMECVCIRWTTREIIYWSTKSRPSMFLLLLRLTSSSATSPRPQMSCLLRWPHTHTHTEIPLHFSLLLHLHTLILKTDQKLPVKETTVTMLICSFFFVLGFFLHDYIPCGVTGRVLESGGAAIHPWMCRQLIAGPYLNIWGFAPGACTENPALLCPVLCSGAVTFNELTLPPAGWRHCVCDWYAS